MVKMRKVHLLFLSILLLFIILGFGFILSKSDEIRMIKYLRSETFLNDLTSIEFAINNYERVFYQKPIGKQNFVENIPNWFNEDDPLSHLSDDFFELNLKLEAKTTMFYINSLLFFNSKKEYRQTKHFKSLSLFDAFFFNGTIILDSMPIINEGLYNRPPTEVFFVKNGMPFYDADSYAKFEYSLKLFSLVLINDFGIETSQFNRFRLVINGKEESLKILFDKNGFIQSNPDIKKRLIRFLQNNKQIYNYDEVYFSLSLFPEIITKN